MNYSRHYDALINRAIDRSLSVPTESHHIVPRCMGGGDGRKNRVDLTPEEHYVAHQLLVKMYPKHLGLATAAAAMAIDNRNGKRSNNKLYGWLRKRAAEAHSIRQTGAKRSAEACKNIGDGIRASAASKEYYASRVGVPRTEAVKAKVSDSHKTSEKARAARAILNANKIGKPVLESTKRAISEAMTGRTLNADHRSAISSALKGKPKTAEHIAAAAAGLKGNQNALGAVRSEATRQKMREAATGRKMSPEAIAKGIASKTPEQRRAGALKAWETKRKKAAA